MTIEELHGILAIDESYRIERTVSTGNMDKFQKAICAFAKCELGLQLGPQLGLQLGTTWT